MVDSHRPADFRAPAYTITARALHWITAALVLTQIPLGLLVVNVKMGAWHDGLYNLHKSIGAVLIPIVLFRLAYRLTHPPAPMPVFGLFELPHIWREDRALSDQLYVIHRFIGIALACLLVGHIGAALQ